MSARQRAILWCVLLCLPAAGCFKPHRAPIAQGNVIQMEDAKRLETGMTRSQVEYLIGRPILEEPLDNSRWNYVFYFRVGHKEPQRSHISLHFEDDVLTSIDGDLQAYAGRKVENQLEDEPETIEDEDSDEPEQPPIDPTDPTDRPATPGSPVP